MGGGTFREKKCHPKMMICRHFHPNRTMGKCIKGRGSGFLSEGGNSGDGGGGKF